MATHSKLDKSNFMRMWSRRKWLGVSANALLYGAWRASAEEAKRFSEEATVEAKVEEAGIEDPSRMMRFRFVDSKRILREVAGRILVEGQDGSLLVQGNDGRIWPVASGGLQERIETSKNFSAMPSEEIGRQLLQEFGAGFQAYISEHYIVCSNASEPYSKWCSGLLERLQKAFRDYWDQRKLKTVQPLFPLVVLLFETQEQFGAFATKDVGPELASVPGYFVIPSNRIALYDLTSASRGRAARTVAEIEQKLGSAQGNIATVIHEATHQIAFNCGMHTRMADNPVWLTEGMATYFETPDLRNKAGWRTAGLINRPRLKKFREFLSQRRSDSLQTLLQNDARLITAETAEDAYAESWALTYFLVRKQLEPYVRYLSFLAMKRPLDFPTPEQRIAEFTEIFGDLKKLDADFLRYTKSLK